MLKGDMKTLKYNHGESMKVPFIIYADFESLIEKMSTCHNNTKKSSTTSGYSLFTTCPFDTTKNKLNYYRDKNCMKNLSGFKRACNKNN